MTKKLDLITVDGINYLIDTSVSNYPDINHLYYNHNIKTIAKRSEGTSDQSYIGFAKIIAVEYPNEKEGLHQFKLEDENLLSLEAYPIKTEWSDGSSRAKHSWDDNKINREIWIDGYKANKAKWSDEDMQDIFREGYNLCLSKHFKFLEGKIHPDEVPYERPPMGDEEYIESLNKSKKIESIEVEYDNRCCGRCDGEDDICHADRTCIKHSTIGCEVCFGKRDWQPKLDKDGLLTINKINYYDGSN